MLLFTLPWKGRAQAPPKKPAKDVLKSSRRFCCPRRGGEMEESLKMLSYRKY